jgi:hypothetical protein
MIDPVEADPSLTFPFANASAPVPTPAQAMQFARPVQDVLRRNGMLAGYVIGGSDSDVPRSIGVGRARLLSVTVLRFADAGAARPAAQQIDAVDAAVSPDNAAVPIPEHSDAHGHWRPTVPTLAATVAQDSFVVSVLTGEHTTDLAALSKLADRALTAQLARVRTFRPTPSDQLASLPLDPYGVLGRMISPAPGIWQRPAVLTYRNSQNAGLDAEILPYGVVYGPRATARWAGWRDSGAMSAFYGFDQLVLYPNAAGARKDLAEARNGTEDPGVRVVGGPPGITDAQCVESLYITPFATRYACRVIYGRYEAILNGRVLKDLQQRTAAQYVMLVESE